MPIDPKKQPLNTHVPLQPGFRNIDKGQKIKASKPAPSSYNTKIEANRQNGNLKSGNIGKPNANIAFKDNKSWIHSFKQSLNNILEYIKNKIQNIFHSTKEDTSRSSKNLAPQPPPKDYNQENESQASSERKPLVPKREMGTDNPAQTKGKPPTPPPKDYNQENESQASSERKPLVPEREMGTDNPAQTKEKAPPLPPKKSYNQAQQTKEQASALPERKPLVPERKPLVPERDMRTDNQVQTKEQAPPLPEKRRPAQPLNPFNQNLESSKRAAATNHNAKLTFSSPTSKVSTTQAKPSISGTSTKQFDDVCQFATQLEGFYKSLPNEYKQDTIDEYSNKDEAKDKVEHFKSLWEDLDTPPVDKENLLLKMQNIKDFTKFLNEKNTLPCYADSAVTIMDESGQSIHPYHGNVVHMPSGDVIAAQGPLPSQHSRGEKHQTSFFKMVYGTDSPVIVDLTNNTDPALAKRTTNYTPTQGSQKILGDMTVKNIRETTVMDGKFTIQELVIKDKPCIRIQHNQFDDKTPGKIADLVVLSLLIDRIEITQDRSKKVGPPIIHCTAGIGRTGTTTVILDQVKSCLNGERPINPFHAITRFRSARGPSGVQTGGQLATILKANQDMESLLSMLQ